MPDVNTPPSLDETKIDLGEDLVEKTRMLPILNRPKGSSSESPVDLVQKSIPTTPETIEDRLQTAKILINEGFLEEAKKQLHQILIAHPGNSFAQRFLEDIQKIELKTIFGEGQIK